MKYKDYLKLKESRSFVEPHENDFVEIDENGVEVVYPYNTPIPPHNYDKWPAREHSDWEDMDLHERLTADPSYMDRI